MKPSAARYFEMRRYLLAREKAALVFAARYRAKMSAAEFFAAGIGVAPLGCCQCGCKERTSVAMRNSTRDGYVKGQPLLFLAHHGYRPRGIAIAPRDCWEWQGCHDEDGYGFVKDNTLQVRAHRWVFGRVFGAAPEWLRLDHLCRNPSCVNPLHLDPVSVAVNTRRGLATRLTVEDVLRIRDDRNQQGVIAGRFGISQSHVSRIKNRVAWDDDFELGLVEPQSSGLAGRGNASSVTSPQRSASTKQVPGTPAPMPAPCVAMVAAGERDHSSPVSPPPGDKPAPSIQAARAESSTPAGVLGSSGNARAGSGTYLTRKDSGCGEPCPPVRIPDALFDPEPFTRRTGMEWSWA